MKKNIIYALFSMLLIVLVASCSFDRPPQGSTITQEQYEKLSNTLEGSLRGIYSLLYSDAGDDHDWFSTRSIDMYQDILSGDMALTASNYGWFGRDEMGMTIAYRSGTLWTYYYRMLHNTNAVLRIVDKQAPELLSKINEFGLETDTIYTDGEIRVAYFYAQALAMRGWIYSQLVKFYVPETADLNKQAQSTLSTWKAIPVYTEKNMDEPQPLSMASQVYNQLEADLTTAIDIFEAFKTHDAFVRKNKLEMCSDVACAILAYSYLNKGGSQENYEKALDYATQAIDNHNFAILPFNELTTNGFNNVQSVNWMWGLETTKETVVGLPSFWGQVDIHSYSYAWIGDTKVIDDALYKQIPEFDGRRNWFNSGALKAVYKLCPDGKFFSKKNSYSTKSDDLDREWLNDDVYMRYEVLYLIAAEAACRLGENAKAVDFLTQLMDNRVDSNDPEAMAAYDEYKTKMASEPDFLLKGAIALNWRVEMWGEGYGWQTFRRITKESKLGSNHDSKSGRANKTIYSSEADYMYFQIPANEETYNPNY